MSAALKRTYVSVIHAEQVRVSFMRSKKAHYEGFERTLLFLFCMISPQSGLSRLREILGRSFIRKCNTSFYSVLTRQSFLITTCVRVRLA